MIQLDLLSISIPAKPAAGEPCTQCGQCCVERPCTASALLLGTPDGARCAMLRWEGAGYVCGLLAWEATLVAQGRLKAAILPTFLGLGRGCGEDDALTCQSMGEAMDQLWPLHYALHQAGFAGLVL